MFSASGSRVPRTPVCFWELCHRFNALRLYDRAARRELQRIIFDENAPDPANNQPTGTRSQFIHFKEWNGRLVAMAHHYARPDRATPEDPKRLIAGGYDLVPAHAGHDTCPDCAYWEPLARRSRRVVR